MVLRRGWQPHTAPKGKFKGKTFDPDIRVRCAALKKVQAALPGYSSHTKEQEELRKVKIERKELELKLKLNKIKEDQIEAKRLQAKLKKLKDCNRN